MKKFFLRRDSLIKTTAIVSVLFFSSCQEQKQEVTISENSEYPRTETLYIGGFDWAPPTTFNPLDYDPNFPIDGNVRLMYETLVTYNQLTGKLEPMLAESFSQNDSSISVKLDSRAKWSDGSAVTVEDVIYTFRIDSLLPTPRHPNWKYISKIESKDNTITFHFSKDKNPLVLLSAIAETSILPKSVFEPIIKAAKTNKGYDMEKIAEFKNDSSPIVSGPYNLKTYSPDKIVLERNSNYWGNIKHGGKMPAPKYIIHSLYNGNNHFNSAMTKGNLDISSIFLPRIWEKAKDSIRSWSREEPFHQPGSITTLIVAHNKAPLNDVALRRALMHSINFEKIKARAVSNYTPAMQPGFILPFGSEEKYFDKNDANTYGYSYNTDKAKEILLEAGYSWNNEGKLLDPSKKPLRTFTIECPQGWTDWEDAIKVIAGSFAEIGVTAVEKFVDYAVWDKDLRLGTFDFAMKTQTAFLSPATPWTRFDQVMNGVYYKPTGEDAFANQGRYQNKEANELLTRISAETDENTLKEAYRALNKIFMETIPVMPVLYRPTQYYQFSTKHWTNFPTEENPYAPPQHLILAAGVNALWEIRSVK